MYLYVPFFPSLKSSSLHVSSPLRLRFIVVSTAELRPLQWMQVLPWVLTSGIVDSADCVGNPAARQSQSKVADSLPKIDPKLLAQVVGRTGRASQMSDLVQCLISKVHGSSARKVWRTRLHGFHVGLMFVSGRYWKRCHESLNANVLAKKNKQTFQPQCRCTLNHLATKKQTEVPFCIYGGGCHATLWPGLLWPCCWDTPPLEQLLKGWSWTITSLGASFKGKKKGRGKGWRWSTKRIKKVPWFISVNFICSYCKVPLSLLVDGDIETFGCGRS